ncbi:DUF2971 domain-containing protein [Aeromonas hydrophila]|uniref:DUF2971 domain-containing protein n=1 Tax=Aeromonas hydrophila TaxID=644 RepID=UPI003D1CD415
MSLYKFHTFNENSISALESYSAWFAKPVTFNDPFEGLYKEVMNPINEALAAELIRYILHDRPEYIETLLNSKLEQNEWLNEMLIDFCKSMFRTQQANFHDSGVCCFINDGNVNPYEEPLMWGHYGNGLKGYAIEFESPSLNLFEHKNIGAVQVNYENEPPVIDCLGLTMRYIKKHNSDGNSIVPEILKIMTTKSKWWEYENEMRFISFMDGNKLIKYNEGAIKSIIIGTKMPEWQKRTIKAIADKHQITDLKEAFTRDDSYKVGLRELLI